MRRPALRDILSVVGPGHFGCALAPHIPIADTNHCSWCGTERLRRAEARRRHKSQWRCHQCDLKYTGLANALHPDYRKPLTLAEARSRLEQVS